MLSMKMLMKNRRIGLLAHTYYRDTVKKCIQTTWMTRSETLKLVESLRESLSDEEYRALTANVPEVVCLLKEAL